MSRTFEVQHKKKEHNHITLDGHEYCSVFDDRWKSGILDPRTWQVRLKRGDSTLLQLEFLTGTNDVIIQSPDGRNSMMQRKGILKKHFELEWNGIEYSWSKTSDGYALRAHGDEAILATRQDTDVKEGVISRITVHPSARAMPASSAASMMSEVTLVDNEGAGNVSDLVVLASALSIGAANINGGVLTSRPPTGCYSTTSGRLATAGPTTGSVMM